MDDSDDEYAAKSSPPPDDNPELDLMLSRIHSPSSSRDNTQPPTSPTPVGGENSSRGGLTSARGCGQKRPIEDLTQFAESAARNVKLKPAGKNHLIQFSKMTSPQQRLTIAAHLFKVEERQGELPTTQLTEYSLGQRTKTYIDRMSFNIIISPGLASYVDKGPLNTLLGKVEKKWPDAKKDERQWAAIVERSGGKLTDWRYEAKKVISGSLGTINPDDETKRVDASDIITLCTDILKKSDLEPSLEMCARVAFLRRTLVKSIKAAQDTGRELNYWKLVDSELKKVRDQNKNNRAKIHKSFKLILTKDQELYGAVATENLPSDAPDPATLSSSED